MGYFVGDKIVFVLVNNKLCDVDNTYKCTGNNALSNNGTSNRNALDMWRMPHIPRRFGILKDYSLEGSMHIYSTEYHTIAAKCIILIRDRLS